MEREHNIRKRHSSVFGIIILLVAYCMAFTAGYGLTAFIYRFTGQPPEIFRHLFTGLLAVIIILIGWRFILKFGGGTNHQKDILNIHNELTNTLAQIAKGNFDVLLDPAKVGFFNDLALAINDMAQNLGTLETMRQDFISNVSHEIQTPLTSIGGFAALMQKDGLPGGERQKYAAIIEAESKRLSSLSENLLKLSSLDNNKTPLTKKEFRLDKQLEQIALTLEPQWSAKNIELEADLKKIADTGAGIAPEDQMHIFERFYKADKARNRSLGGNGLGLSLVKKIIELHSGSVTVESEIGKGTTFEIILPI